MNELQKLLTPKKVNPKYIKKRFGVQDYDGGYILIDNLEFKNNTVLGLGVDGDYSCELQLQKKYSGDVHLYDGSVDIDIKENNVYFYKEYVTANNINSIFDKFEKITFKMDIEGMEHMALAGAQTLIKQYQPICFVEIFKTDQAFVKTFFKGLGYQAYEIRAEDWLFIPEESSIMLDNANLVTL